MKSLDMTRLQMSYMYEDFKNETAPNKDVLIKLLKRLSEVITAYNKRILMFAARQGKLLKDGITFFGAKNFNMCGSHVGFPSDKPIS